MARFREQEFEGQGAVRRLLCYALARRENVAPADIAERQWSTDKALHATLILKADVPGAGSTSGQWGAELAQAEREDAEFYDFLKSATVFDRLAMTQAPFNMRLRLGVTPATGGFVQEGKGIKASAQAFATAMLQKLKLAALSVESLELALEGGPEGERAIRDGLAEALRIALDSALLGTAARVDRGNPAGLLHGVSGTASAGPDAPDLLADIDVLVQALATAKLAQSIVLIAAPSTAGRIGLMLNDFGERAFPDATASGGKLAGYDLLTSDQCDTGKLIAVNPSAILRADAGVTLTASSVTAIEQSSAPTGDALTPAAATQAFTSMFTSDSVATKALRLVDWVVRDAAAIQVITGCDYALAPEA